MRPSNNKRSRSKQNRPRTLGNIINRVFDSSGPEGKVRGTPQQIIDKYALLARDAQLSGDRVAAENFLQHAEHYTRMLTEAQAEMARESDQRRDQFGGQQGGGQQGSNQQGSQNNGQQNNNSQNTGGQTYGNQNNGGQGGGQNNGGQNGGQNNGQNAPQQQNRRNDQRNDQRSDSRNDQRGDQRHDPRGEQPRQDQRGDQRSEQRPDQRNDQRTETAEGESPDWKQQRNRRFDERRAARETTDPRDEAPREDRVSEGESMLVETPESRADTPPRRDEAAAPARSARNTRVNTRAVKPVEKPVDAAGTPAAADLESPATEAAATSEKPAAKPRAPRARKPKAEAPEPAAPDAAE